MLLYFRNKEIILSFKVYSEKYSLKCVFRNVLYIITEANRFILLFIEHEKMYLCQAYDSGCAIIHR